MRRGPQGLASGRRRARSAVGLAVVPRPRRWRRPGHRGDQRRQASSDGRRGVLTLRASLTSGSIPSPLCAIRRRQPRPVKVEQRPRSSDGPCWSSTPVGRWGPVVWQPSGRARPVPANRACRREGWRCHLCRHGGCGPRSDHRTTPPCSASSTAWPREATPASMPGFALRPTLWGPRGTAASFCSATARTPSPQTNRQPVRVPLRRSAASGARVDVIQFKTTTPTPRGP